MSFQTDLFKFFFLSNKYNVLNGLRSQRFFLQFLKNCYRRKCFILSLLCFFFLVGQNGNRKWEPIYNVSILTSRSKVCSIYCIIIINYIFLCRSFWYVLSEEEELGVVLWNKWSWTDLWNMCENWRWIRFYKLAKRMKQLNKLTNYVITQ